MKEVWVNCPDCADTGPHLMWRDSTGEPQAACNCGHAWSPAGVL